MNKLSLAIITLLFILGFIFRLYKFSEPVADWHSFRQSDTAAVSQIFISEGYNLLYPKYFDVSNIQSGLDNPNGYRFVEFPIYNFLHAFFYSSIGMLSFEQWGRLINIFASLITGFVIFSFLRKYYNNFAAYAGLIAFLFLPFSIYYSRVILPDIMMTTFIMLGIYFFDKHLEKNKSKRKVIVFYLSSILFTTIAFLLKPFALFFTLPFLYLAYVRYGVGMFSKLYLYIFPLITITPFYLWRTWISQFPEGVPSSDWLFNGNGIRFRPAFFRWIFFERLTKLILGYFGVLFLLSSLLDLKNKKMLFFFTFAFSSLIYLFVIATGNVQHDYYQIIMIPTVSMFIGIGASQINKFLSRRINKSASIIVVSIIFILSFYFSWMQVKDFFNINDRGMVEAAQRVDALLPQDALVIAPYDGSTTFLNLSKRRGWTVFQEPIEKLIERGAQYLIIANPTKNDFSGFGTQYETVDSSDKYLILKLK